MTRNLISWGIYFAFVLAAIAFSWHDGVLQFNGTTGFWTAVVWAAFVLFTGHSLQCSRRESLFESIGGKAQLHWGRQVGIDLYLGLLLFLAVIYVHSGLAVLLLLLLPTLLFANFATLLYLAVHSDSLVSRFLS